MNFNELREFLDEKYDLYNRPDFIDSDPIQIPHLFTQKEDIEIAGFLASTIAWGNRKMIIKNAHRMMELMGNSPYDFVLQANGQQLENLHGFVHRTFNGADFVSYITALRHIYQNHGGLETVFAMQNIGNLQERITYLKTLFNEVLPANRALKHVSDPAKNSAAKRINMYLRWMVRKDQRGVDLGIWENISSSELSCPLDVHSGNVARKLGLLTRKQNDGKALAELDKNLRLLDAQDPVKYDFALFGLGVFEGF